jgi:hypothetical protein
VHNVASTHIGHLATQTKGRTVETLFCLKKAQEAGKEEEEMVHHVASTHSGNFATKTEGGTVEKEL